MRKRKNRGWGDRVLLCTSALLLAFGCISLSFFPAARFSATENRNLADFPSFSPSSLAAGSFTAALDTYAAERFPARLALRRIRAAYQLAVGSCEVGDVLLCRDGSLARRMTVNDRILNQNLAAIQHLAALTDLPLTVAVAPRRIDARKEVLPTLYDASENEAVWRTLQRQVPQAVTFSALTSDAHWYRTDHHWSTEGAYRAYCQLGDYLGYTPHPIRDFSIETVSNDFYGTSQKAAGIPFLRADSIQLYRYAGDESFAVCLNGKPAPFSGFYDRSKLLTQDQYGIFFGGNYGSVTVAASDALPTLLVVKDSFANAMLPFLARHFRIHAVDPRYTDQSLSSLMQNADRVLLLCGMQTLCEIPMLRSLEKADG